MTKLFVGHCNGKGGLSYVDTDVGVETLHDVDTRGTAYVDGALYSMRKTGMFMRTPDTKPTGRQISDIVNDWHGLVYYDGRLWAVDPVSDTLVEFQLDGHFIARWHWKHTEGRMHTNDMAIWNDQIWQCTFNKGICHDGIPTGHGTGHQSHSIIHWDGHALYCASNKGEVRCFAHGSDKEEAVWQEPEAFTRGLCATGEGLWIGHSMKRHGAGGSKARIVLLGWDNKVIHDISFPDHNEVYSITVVS